MKSKLYGIVLLILLIPSLLFSQKIGELYLPARTTGTPGFFNVFYQENFTDNLNVFELDVAAREYEEAFEKTHQPDMASDESHTGEENEDIYILISVPLD